jgi:hypothetical protein
MRHITGAAMLAIAVVVAGCSSGGRATRETPAGTIEQFKVAARIQNHEEEWDILSPDLKRRLSKMAGRSIDYADYVTFINSQKSSPEYRQAMTALQAAQVGRVVMHSANRATATISGPMGIGGQHQVGMVRLDRWELLTRDDPQPYNGIVGDPDIRVTRGSDGGYTVTMHNPATGQETWRQSFPATDVTNYTVASKWYVDDLGGLESQFAPMQ